MREKLIGWERVVFPPKERPRVCGEHSSSAPFIRCATGSPPRVRGRCPNHGDIVDRPWITPARAGKVTDLLRSSRAHALSAL